MSAKRGQPPKPEEEHRTVQVSLMYNKRERAILQEAYKKTGDLRPFGRWLAELTITEAMTILGAKKE
jgi:hypothetical protein